MKMFPSFLHYIKVFKVIGDTSLNFIEVALQIPPLLFLISAWRNAVEKEAAFHRQALESHFQGHSPDKTLQSTNNITFLFIIVF